MEAGNDFLIALGAELKVELERRVDQRTSELAAVNQLLQETQRKFEEAQRIAHVGHWERDLETDAIIWSAEAYRIFGLPPHSRPISFQEFLKWVHPEDRERVVRSVEEAVRELRHYGVDYRIVRADGKERFVHSQGEVLRDELGHPLRAFGTLQDITQRKEAENSLRQSETQLRLVIDTIPAMAWIILPDGTLDFINQRWLEYTGLTLKESIEQPTSTIHPEDLPRVMEKWSRDMAAGEPSEDEMRLRRADGEYRWFLIRTAPLRDDAGDIIRWYGTGVDITDRRRAEEQIRATSEQLRALSARLGSAREEESTRIAREIHDELGGALSSLRWDLEDVNEVISESPERAQLAALRQKIEAMIRLADTTVDTVRRITSELRPIALDEFGLTEAIRWHAQQFQARTGIVVHCDFFPEDADLNREQSTAVFRIFQEALTNILRHAQATRVDIMTKEEAEEFFLRISDNG